MLPVLVFAALAGVEVAKGVMQSMAASEKQNALAMKSQLQLLQYQQKKLSTYDLLQNTLANQTAQATVRGVSLDSSSFNAIQRNTMNVGSRMLGNEEIENDLLQRNSKFESANVQKTLYAQLFGDAAELGYAAVSSPAMWGNAATAAV